MLRVPGGGQKRLKISLFSASFFDRFGTSGGIKNVQKPLAFVGQNEDACFCAMIALEIDFGSIFDYFWDRFWNDFGVQTRSQKQLKI